MPQTLNIKAQGQWLSTMTITSVRMVISVNHMNTQLYYEIVSNHIQQPETLSKTIIQSGLKHVQTTTKISNGCR